MHHSRVSFVLIDCAADRMDEGVEFWAGALGMRPRSPSVDSGRYVFFDGQVGDLGVALQRVDDDSRIHLDIETDDIEAEVVRLEALGARRKQQMDSFWIMEAPSGHLFCVIPPQSEDFPDNANLWEM